MLEVHVLASGSDGNCTVVQLDDAALMVDAGLSYRRTHQLMEAEGIDESSIKALLVTHEHSDHVTGAGAVCRKLGIPMYCNAATFGSFNHGKVDWHPIETSSTFDLGGFGVTVLPTSHDAVEPNAFMFAADGKKVLVATDTGVLTFPLRQALADSDLAIIEANYDSKMLREGPYPYPLKQRISGDHGHMCNAVTAAEIKRTMGDHDRKIFLAHLSKINNLPDVARETVAEITGIKRYKIDCLEGLGDTRTLTVLR